VIGCGLLLGDDASYYYVKDLMVHPSWQNKHVGSKLMRAITDWIDKNAQPNAFICLFTGENMESFYKHFDFTPAFGMMRSVRRDA
jgi:GNAT superfamily N-acetyltransferase